MYDVMYGLNTDELGGESTVDWASLSRDKFQDICQILLASEQYGILTSTPYIVANKDNNTVTIQLVHTAGSVHPERRIRDGRDRLFFAIERLGFKKGLLIISTDLRSGVIDTLKDMSIDVWDRTTLDQLVVKHKSALPIIKSTPTVDPLDKDPQARKLAEALKALPEGKKGWRAYEDLCIDVFEYLFSPALKLSDIQSWSEDGLDRRDAILSFDLTSENRVWQRILSDCNSRFVVVDFKNLSSPLTQRDVESVQQYLFTKALRTFGVVCGRQGASDSAIKARRRAWVESSKLIVFLSDEDLLKMLEYKAEKKDPVDHIDTQLVAFFRDLAP